MPLPVHHVAVQVADLAGCERFYREVLGLPVLRRWPAPGGGERSVWLTLGEGAFLALERAEATGGDAAAGAARATGPASGAGGPTVAPEGTADAGDGTRCRPEQGGRMPPRGVWLDPRPGLHLLALRIGAGERSSWEARLAAARVEVVHRTRWTIYVLDPEGNRIGLSHHPEEAP